MTARRHQWLTVVEFGRRSVMIFPPIFKRYACLPRVAAEMQQIRLGAQIYGTTHD